MNPEDLLRMEAIHLSKLPNEKYKQSNDKVLKSLRQAGINYSYSRISMDDNKYGDDVKSWNKDMALWQKLRIRSSQIKESSGGGEDDGNIIVEAEYSSGSDE